MFERNVLLVFPNKKCATVEREKCTMEHQTIFQQLKQYNTSSEPIPSAQCDECTKLLIQALTTSANVAHMMSAQERAEYKEVMKRFFARLKEVMTEKNVMDIEKVLQNSLLWFLAPFCKSLCEKFKQSKVTYDVLMKFLGHCTLPSSDQDLNSVVSKMAIFLINRIASIIDETNFSHFIDFFAEFRGSKIPHLESVSKKVDEIWLKLWDEGKFSYPRKVSRRIANGIFILNRGNITNSRYIIEILPLLEDKFYFQFIESISQNCPLTFNPYMLSFSHHRQILLVNKIIFSNFTKDNAKKLVSLLFDLNTCISVRERIACLMYCILKYSTPLFHLFMDQFKRCNLSDIDHLIIRFFQFVPQSLLLNHLDMLEICSNEITVSSLIDVGLWEPAQESHSISEFFVNKVITSPMCSLRGLDLMVTILVWKKSFSVSHLTQLAIYYIYGYLSYHMKNEQCSRCSEQTIQLIISALNEELLSGNVIISESCARDAIYLFNALLNFDVDIPTLHKTIQCIVSFCSSLPAEFRYMLQNSATNSNHSKDSLVFPDGEIRCELRRRIASTYQGIHWEIVKDFISMFKTCNLGSIYSISVEKDHIKDRIVVILQDGDSIDDIIESVVSSKPLTHEVSRCSLFSTKAPKSEIVLHSSSIINE